MQRARLVFHGAVYIWRGLPQLSSRISARLSKRCEALAMGPDQMADLDSIQAPVNEQSAPSATGGNLLLASATLEFTKGQKPLTRATEIGRIQTFGISCASNMQ